MGDEQGAVLVFLFDMMTGELGLLRAKAVASRAITSVEYKGYPQIIISIPISTTTHSP